MNVKSRKILKRVLISFSIFLIFGIIYIYYGLKMLDIEDRYGDLQNIYWSSKNDDIALNKKNMEYAIIKKQNNRIYIIENSNKIDIDYWLNHDDYDYDVEIYRPQEKDGIEKFNSEQLKLLVKDNRTKLIEKIYVNY